MNCKESIFILFKTDSSDTDDKIINDKIMAYSTLTFPDYTNFTIERSKLREGCRIVRGIARNLITPPVHRFLFEVMLVEDEFDNGDGRQLIIGILSSP